MCRRLIHKVTDRKRKEFDRVDKIDAVLKQEHSVRVHTLNLLLQFVIVAT
jgi:hypothetical protein